MKLTKFQIYTKNIAISYKESDEDRCFLGLTTPIFNGLSHPITRFDELHCMFKVAKPCMHNNLCQETVELRMAWNQIIGSAS